MSSSYQFTIQNCGTGSVTPGAICKRKGEQGWLKWNLREVLSVRYDNCEIFSNATLGATCILLFSLMLALICCLTTQAAIWVGMTKAELLQELGPPNTTLAVGNREVLDYGGSRKAQFLNGRVFKLTGFPESMISEVQAPDPIENARASTAYSPPPTSTSQNKQNGFVDFGAINNQQEETFTLSSPEPDTSETVSPSIRDRIEPLIAYIESMDRQTLTLRGCGIGASVAFAILIILTLKRRSAAKKRMRVGEADSKLPPFLKSKPQEKPSILDPREPPKLRGGERKAIQKNPESRGLSIRGPIYQDYDPDYDPNAPRRQLVGANTAPKNNEAYSGAASHSADGDSQTQEPNSPGTEKSSPLKLKLSED